VVHSAQEPIDGQEDTVAKHAKKAAPHGLERLSGAITKWTGSTAAFATACSLVILWLVTGPVFGYSNTWQLVINTGTTIITFLMVFLIQRSQNKESIAVQLKLNELVAAVEGASNRLIDVEDLSEEELESLRQFYAALVQMAKKDNSLTSSHSIEDAESWHERKKPVRRKK
jgi:low affinity Fe/Cu permease